MIIGGILLILAEIFIIPGIGVAGILGVLSMAGSCYYSFVKLGTTAGIIVTIVNIVLMTAAIIFFLRSKTWKKFELKEVIDSKGVEEPIIAVGSIGISTTRLAPMGGARICDKNVEVTSLEGMLDPQTRIIVDRVENNKYFVRKAPAPAVEEGEAKE